MKKLNLFKSFCLYLLILSIFLSNSVYAQINEETGESTAPDELEWQLTLEEFEKENYAKINLLDA